MKPGDENLLGHNAAGIQVRCEVRMFNSVSRFAGSEGRVRRLSLPALTFLPT